MHPRWPSRLLLALCAALPAIEAYGVARCAGPACVVFPVDIPASAAPRGAANPLRLTAIHHPEYAVRDDDNEVRQRRRERWDSLSPDEQERVRRGRERYRALPQDEKERLRRAQRQFLELPPERREELKRRWQDDTQRRGSRPD